MGDEPRGLGLGRIVWILAGLLVVAAAGQHILHNIHGSSIRLSLFRASTGLRESSPCSVLTNGFYVVSQTNPETKHHVSNVLVKRGKELHEPDRMYINPNQIVFVETVGTNSAVAQGPR
jgi:hypothetical protein